MRQPGDGRRDWQIKYDLFNEEIRCAYDVIGVFDDRLQVVRMWRHLGLTVFQVADGNF